MRAWVDPITVTTAIIAGNPNRSLADQVHVTETIFARVNNISRSVTDSITVSPRVGYAGPIVALTVDDTITVSPTLELPAAVRPALGHRQHHGPDQLPESGPVRHQPAPDHLRRLPHGRPTRRAGAAPSGSFQVTDTISVADLAGARPIYFTVADAITATTVVGGGSSQRLASASDMITVTDVSGGRSNKVRLPVTDRVLLLESRTAVAHDIFITVADAIHIREAIAPRAPYTFFVADAITILDATLERSSSPRFTLVDAITVGEGLRFSPVGITVVDAITLADQGSPVEINVSDRITVATTLRRDYDALLVDTLPITQVVTTSQTHHRSVLDTLPIAESALRSMVWERSPTDTLVFPAGSFQRFLVFANTLVSVPVAVGTLVNQIITLQSPTAVITLPAPLLADGLDNVARTTIQRSMNAKLIVFKQSTIRQRLKYSFRLDKVKAFELRVFIESNLSTLLTLTTWDAQVWAVYRTTNPFELSSGGRGAGADEFATIELIMEGEKLSG